jgi:hypothetical protein
MPSLWSVTLVLIFNLLYAKDSVSKKLQYLLFKFVKRMFQITPGRLLAGPLQVLRNGLRGDWPTSPIGLLSQMMVATTVRDSG